jgi:hypothetical protein
MGDDPDMLILVTDAQERWVAVQGHGSVSIWDK